MDKLALYSLVASLSFAICALFTLRGMPQQLPFIAAAIVSALIFAALFVSSHRKTMAS